MGTKDAEVDATKNPSCSHIFLAITLCLKISLIFDLALFITCIWGSVVVFGNYPEWGDDDTDQADKCPAKSYMFAFVFLVCSWLLMPLMFALNCCKCCCAMCFAGRKIYQQANVEFA